ncbi:hypothetical protein [Pelosinus baikalensis]|uniref:Uncharacterized protein n=1 Tax=Pelosinus baikalensis TaxID=2892015 RepID=A0ABS8HTS4_9FIRM|nr:hypothetical protein [Pelosinus baikalensis]MCC5465527.1 hypothetical protein [Pelosinus baikalensis]
MNQIFALKFNPVNLEGDNEESYLDEEETFFNTFQKDPILKVSRFPAHVEGSTFPKSLFNTNTHKIKIETTQLVTVEQFNALLMQYINDNGKEISKIEAVEELSC